ncbi:MAG: CBS domain-containing protein, partial [Gammaproteobacteria bacterium]|nr:CBS domain-containing protein [Gammaproteobacteria bacterium]
LEARGFTEEDFARSHPGGTLGRRLLLHINDIMHLGEEVPVVTERAQLLDALMEMTNKGMGMTAVVNDTGGALTGIFTDGDLRRALDRRIRIDKCIVSQVMTRDCITATPGMLAAEALKIMQDNKINALLILDETDHLLGALNMHDLLRAGVV